MNYTKQPLTFEQQADLLISRGLQADRDFLISHLKSVYYYRLNSYLYPFRMRDKKFKPGTTFEIVWRRYTFDRRLRVLLMDAIERVEIAVRTQVGYHFSHAKGPFGYTDGVNLLKLSQEEHEELLARLIEETDRSKEILVELFKKKHGDVHTHLPLWIALEIMSFGILLTFFRGVEPGIKQKIAIEFGIPDKVLWSWLRSLNAIRNICAHHSRLWNRELGYKPLLPNERKYPEWYVPVEIKNNRVFGILTILKYLLDKIAPQSKWSSRLISLLNEYGEIPLKSMGFPTSWTANPIWKNCKGMLNRSSGINRKNR
jgi:abortive infection bacteriophage resistance protein